MSEKSYREKPLVDKKYVQDLLRASFVLFLICMIAATGLGFTNEITKEKVKEQRALIADRAKSEVLPEATTFIEIREALKSPVSERISGMSEELLDGLRPQEKVGSIFLALDAEKNPEGIVVFAYPSGYGGEIEVVVGMKMTPEGGVIEGVRIGSHAETPGLGEKAKKPEFYTQYGGKKTSSKLEVIKSGLASDEEILSISGATITSSAVTRGVLAGCEVYESLFSGVK